ncbi:O-antigen ligase family protein [Aquirufa sp. OSTEICH-129A]
MLSDKLHLKLSSYLASFALFDLLILPRVNFSVLLPISLLFVLIYVPIKFNKKKGLVIFIISIIIILSILFGTIFQDKHNLTKNLQRGFQLLIILSYSQLRIDFDKIKTLVLKILRIYFFWLLFLITIFFYRNDIYASLVSILYPETLEFLEWNIASLRFGYAFSDPNSAAYLTVMALQLYVIIEKNNYLLSMFFFIASLAILFTQSRGGLICLLIVLGFHFFQNGRTKFKIAFIILISLLIFSGFYFYSEYINEFFEIAKSRTEQEESVGGGRIDKYIYFIKNINFLPFGVGYDLYKDGVEFRPHSDLIRLNLSYGIFALPLILYFFLPKSKNQWFFLLIISIPFLINSLIDDYRLFGVALIIFQLISEKKNQYYRGAN